MKNREQYMVVRFWRAIGQFLKELRDDERAEYQETPWLKWTDAIALLGLIAALIIPAFYR